jgi:hypothetical protein
MHVKRHTNAYVLTRTHAERAPSPPPASLSLLQPSLLQPSVLHPAMKRQPDRRVSVIMCTVVPVKRVNLETRVYQGVLTEGSIKALLRLHTALLRLFHLFRMSLRHRALLRLF